MQKRKIPSTGELLPVIGLGTWEQFDVSEQSAEITNLKEVLTAMRTQGGTVIDSSPMYGRSEKIVGDLTTNLQIQDHFFYATKVWTSGREAGIAQMKSSMLKMKRMQMDLMQIHNLLDWKTQLKTLVEWKKEGLIRYIGITHYTDSSHEELATIIRQEPAIDFAQFNYSIANRHAEKALLATAMDNDVAVMVNRPFQGGQLFQKVKNQSLPEWSQAIGINSWGQFFLKYLLGHPAVTCVIPGTSKVKHLLDNMAAGEGEMPDLKMLGRMREMF